MVFSVLHVVWAGGEAVALFFLLSGFVLAGPFWGDDRPSYGAFVARRLFRLWPAYIFVCGLAYVAAQLIPRHALPHQSSWFAKYWSTPHGAVGLWPAAVMGFGEPLNLNPALWSLVVEVRISLVFPLLLGAVRRGGLITFAVAVIISAVCKFAERNTADTAVGLWFATGAQLWLFVLGAELSHRLPLMTRWLPPLRGPVAYGTLGLALLMIVARWTTPLPLPLAYFVSGLGAALLVILAIVAEPFRAMLVTPLSQTLGRLSYAIYLLHFPVLASLAYGLPPKAPFMVAICLVLPITMALALVLHRLIETPGIRAGRVVASWIDKALARGDRGSETLTGARRHYDR